MPTDSTFAHGLAKSLSAAGWQIGPVVTSTNPLSLTLTGSQGQRTLLIHSMRLTPQRRTGPNPSQHNRPLGEWHGQMIFDGDKKGTRQRFQLRQQPDAVSLLVGFVERKGTMLHVAYDPKKHQAYGYSNSLQVKEATLDEANRFGLALWKRATGEVLVAFREEFFPEYLQVMSNSHGLRAPDIALIQYVIARGAAAKLPQNDIVRRAGAAIDDATFRRAVHAVHDCWRP